MRGLSVLTDVLRQKIVWFIGALVLLIATPGPTSAACLVDDHLCESTLVEGRVESIRVRNRPDAPPPQVAPLTHWSRATSESHAVTVRRALRANAPRPKPSSDTTSRLLI